MRSFVSLNLDGIKFLGAILLVISLPFSESLKLISLFFILFILLVQLFKKEIMIEMSAIHYGFISLLLSALLSSIFAANPTKSLKGVQDILYYIIPFFVASTITSKKQIRTILWGLYISTTLAAVFGIFHSITAYRALEVHSLGNQNYTAMYLIIVITSIISTIIFSDKEIRDSKALLSVLAVTLLVASVMTAMRASFLALLIFIFFIISKQKKTKYSFLILAGFICITFLVVYSYPPMWTKLMATESLINRFYIWKHAIKLFQENPIIGIGLNHFKYTGRGETLFDAHNVYLQTASQMGFFGLFSLFLIIFGFLYKFLKLKTYSGFDNAIKYSALGGFLVTFAGGIFDTTLHHEHAIAFTFLAGLMFTVYSKDDK